MKEFKFKLQRNGRFSLMLKNLVIKNNFSMGDMKKVSRMSDKAVSKLYGVNRRW